MNKRIQELIKQATILDDNDLFVREVFDREKFAELIIKEATDIVYDLLDDNTGAEVVVRVKEHFGVEQ